MNDTNIQTLHEDLIEQYHTLAKSHTTAIEQLLEEFNDDQMMFCLEAEAYEEERLVTMTNRAPMTNDHEPELTTTTTTEARQDGPALTDTHITTEQHSTTTTLPESEPIEGGAREDTAIPDSLAKPLSPTPASEQLDQPHAPEDILGILEED